MRIDLRMIGIIFVIIGAIATIYGGLSYATHEDVVEIGSLDFNIKYRETLIIPPILGLLLLGTGVLLMLIKDKESR